MIETFGCQMNDLDSEKISANLRKKGMEPVDDPDLADVVILNTCSVREKAVQKVYARLGEIKKSKNKRPELIVAVVGCMAQLEPDKIFKKAPFVNIIAGPQKGHRMDELITQTRLSNSPVVELRSDDDPNALEYGDFQRTCMWRASVTISEGCNRQCTFCVVPLTRGKERNRDSASIIREIESLVSRGCVEIMLLGQTVNSYRDPYSDQVDFAALLKRIAEIKDLKRIRFMAPHPAYFSNELLDIMVSCPSICNHIHLPVQSGSDKILRAMRRGYTRAQYMELIGKIRRAERRIAISTDIIVGFPGESEKDFEDTLSLIDEVKYDNAFSFKYSPRPNTVASALNDEIPDEEKGRRLEILQQRQKVIQYHKNAAYLGQKVEVLVEGKARSRVQLSGRTTDNKIVNFDGPLSLVGNFAWVQITGFSSNSLRGTLIAHDQNQKAE